MYLDSGGERCDSERFGLKDGDEDGAVGVEEGGVEDILGTGNRHIALELANVGITETVCFDLTG